MITKIQYLIYFIVLGTFSLEVHGKELSLHGAIEIAKKVRTPQRKIIGLARQQADADVNVYRSQVLPRINFSLLRSRNMTPTSKLGIPTNDDHIYSTDTIAKIEMQGPLYSFGRIGAVYDMAQSRRKMSVKQEMYSEQQYLLSVIEAYSQAVLDLQNSIAADQSEVIAKRLLAFTDTEYRSGARSKIDMLRIKSQHLIKFAEKARFRQVADSSKKRLMQLLGINDGVELKPDADEGFAYLQKMAKPGGGVSLPVALKQEEVELNKLLYKYHKASHYPTLSYFGNIQSSISQSVLTNDIEDSDLSEEKFRAGSIGVSFNWTIFSGLEDQSNITKYRSSSESGRIQLEELKKDQTRLERDLSEQVRITKISIGAIKKSAEAIELAFKKAESDYKANAASLTDLLQLEGDLLNEKKRLYTAYKNLIDTMANLQIVQGKKL